jgi:hypothetical protein
MFRVEWLQTALDELARHWLQADSVLRQALTAASHEIDQRLRSDPDNQGESRPMGRRILFVAPLAVTFRIDAGGQTVTVIEIHLFRRRSR